MQTITISGNIGKDAETRTAGNDNVCAFNVGVQQGWGDKKQTNWFRCNLWGKRGDNLQPYLLKGTKVVVQGELTIGEYQGKAQFDIRVNEVEMMSKGDGSRESSSQRRGSGGAASDLTRSYPAGSFDDLSDEVPF